MEITNDIFISLYEPIEDIVLVLDVDCSIEFVNLKGRKSFEISDESYKGKKCYEIICESGNLEQRDLLLSILKNKSPKKNQTLQIKNKLYTLKVSVVTLAKSKEWIILFLNEKKEYIENKNLLKIDSEDVIALNEQFYAFIDAQAKPELTKSLSLETLKEYNDYLKIIIEKYRALYENAPLSYQSLNIEGNILDVNPQWLKTLGYNREEVIGKWFGDFLHSDSRQMFKIRFPKFKKEGVVSGVEFKMTRKDGTEIDVSFEGCIGYDKNGNFRQTYCTFKDVTEERKYNKALQISEERFRLMMEATSDGLWDLNLKTYSIYYSPGWKKMLGYLDREIPNDLTVWQNLTHPDDAENVKQVFESFINGKRDSFEVEFRMKHKKGHWVYILSRANMQKDNNGQPYRIIGSHVDISRIMLQEEELESANKELSVAKQKAEKNEKQYLRLLENINDLVCEIDEEGVYTFVSSHYKEVLGYETNDLIGKRVVDLIHPDDIVRSAERYSHVKKTKEKSVDVWRFRHKNGSYKTIESKGNIYVNENNEKRTVVISRDITEQLSTKAKLKNAANEIEENEKRLIKLFNNISSGVAIYKVINNGEDFKIVGYNSAAVKITGLKAEEVIGKTLLTKFPKIEKSPLFNALQDVNETGRDKYLEPFYYTEDKKEGWRENKIYKLRKDEVVAVFSDVTEKVNNRRQKQLEINIAKEFALSNQNEVFNFVLDHLLEHFKCEFGYIGYINHNGDLECPSLTYKIWDKCKIPDKRIIFSKESWTGAWGENLKTGKTVIKNSELNVPNGHIKLNNTLITLLSDGKNKIGQIALANKKEDFNKYDKESIEHIGRYMSPLVFNTLKEIDYKQMLELHNQRLESLLRITRFNTTSKQELLDYALSEAIDLTQSKIGFIYFYNEDTKQFVLNTWSRDVMKECAVMDPQTTYDLDSTGCWGEVVRQRKSIVINDYSAPNPYKKGTPKGHVKLSKFMSVPVFVNDEIVAVAGVANKNSDYSQTDVSQFTLLMDNVWNICDRLDLVENLKVQKEKAEKADRLKSAFLANMSHEIRTPLNGLMGFTNVMASKKVLSEADRIKYANIIKQSGDQLLNIVNDILDISSIESGTLEIKKNSFEINNVLFSTYKLFEQKKNIAHKSLGFNLKRASKDITLVNDEKRFIQVLTNLLDNAFKFTLKGVVEFGVYEVQKDRVVFYVKDTGIGIEEEFVQIIFDRFRQAEMSSNRLFGGNGLGLSIVKELLSLMGGEIWVESYKDLGSTFYFCLPFSADEPTLHKDRDGIFNVNANITLPQKLNVLVVEDDYVNQEYMREMLSELDINLTMVGLGSQGVIQAKKHNFDIIFMDVRLPDLNGFTATKEIRKFNTKVPIIAQTAYAMSSDEYEAYESGCNGYLSKPIKKELLMEQLKMYTRNELS